MSEGVAGLAGRPRAGRWPAARVAGYAAMTFWIFAAAGVAWYLAAAWDGERIGRYLPAYLSGLGVTLALVGISTMIGALISVPLAYARMSDRPALAWPAYAYVYVFRGTPLIAQTFLVYYGLGSFRPELEAAGLWWFFREAWYCAILAFSLNTAAYQAEILRGAIASVPQSQGDGAASLGLGRLQTLRKIVLPQAMIVALRPYGNELVLNIKVSAIVAIITLYDLMGETRRAYAQTFDFQTYVWAGLIYLATVEALRHAVAHAERRLTRHLAR